MPVGIRRFKSRFTKGMVMTDWLRVAAAVLLVYVGLIIGVAGSHKDLAGTEREQAVAGPQSSSKPGSANTDATSEPTRPISAANTYVLVGAGDIAGCSSLAGAAATAK